MEAGLTPQILVNAAHQGVSVPVEFVRDGAIVLNLHDRAVRNLRMDNDAVSFSARFGGQARNVHVPIDAVLAIYARENGQGLFFEATEADAATSGENAADSDGSEADGRQTPGHGVSPRGKGHLKLV